jgi:lipoprotein-releasing system permease protein
LLKENNHVSSAYIWWLAWRNFSARRQGSGLSFMTTVSILGVTIGVGALVIVLSVMGGFEADLTKKMLAGEPHLEVLADNAVAGFSLKEHPLDSIKGLYPEALAAEPFVSSDVVLKRKGFVVPATLIGVRQEVEGTKLWAFDGAFIDGEIADLAKYRKPQFPQDKNVIRDLPGIALGDQLAAQISADVGDEITVLSPQASTSSALSGGTLARSFVVTGKISTGLFSFDQKWAVASLSEARYFIPEYDDSLREQEYVTGIAMNVQKPLNLSNFESRLLKFEGLKLHTWQMTNKSLLFALKLEKFTMGSILMLIVLVAAFSISGTMMMTVFHKRGQVSILRSLGMSREGVLKLFLANGVVIGTAGVILGMGIGLAVCWFIASSTNLYLPQGTYDMRKLPVKFLPMEYVVIGTCAWILSLAASAYPAIAASNQAPSDGLRYD